MRVVVTGLSKRFMTPRGPVDALAPIDLHIDSGEFVCVLGPSGCGKSTLLRLISGQIMPTTGQIRLDGMTPDEARSVKAIGWMAQRPGLMPWATVIDNVRLPLRVNRRRNRVAPSPEALLEMMGLDEFANAYPATLSGGMQQRVALARTLATGAPVWLMDEPFAALDELTRERLGDEVLGLWTQFRPTIVWVTHHIAEAVRLADRIVVLSERPGRVRDVVPVDLARPRDDTSAEAARLVRHLRRQLGRSEAVLPAVAERERA